jgi:uncharacterized repeat protein (TIGR01451 family)
VLTVCLSDACDHATIQEAVDVAEPGDEIRVATGVYTGVAERDGLRQLVYVDKSLHIRGGYTTTDWTAANPLIYPTVLDAESHGRVIYVTGDVTVSLEGLDVTGGDASGQIRQPWEGEGGAGGGIFVLSATVSISDCSVYGNRANVGAGLSMASGAAHVVGSQVRANDARGLGGGIYLREVAPVTLFDNRIVRNVATWGAGVYDHQSEITLEQNVIADNHADHGGGFVAVGRESRLVGNIIVRNEARHGGGVYLYGVQTVLMDNVLADNRAESLGGGVYARSGDLEGMDNQLERNSGGWGGALYVHGVHGSLAGNELVANAAVWAGAGLYALESDLAVASNRFRENAAEHGGGLYLWSSEAVLTANVMSRNSAVHGGGVSLYKVDATMVNNVIVENDAEGSGDGVFGYASDPRLIHTTVACNGWGERDGDMSDGKGAIHMDSGTALLTNTIIVSNVTGVYAANGATIALERTLWGNGEWSNENDWLGSGFIVTTDNLRQEPDFVDAQAGDYHVEWDSAARDAALGTGLEHDMDGHPRPIPSGGIADLGADETTGIDLSASYKEVSADRATAGERLTYTLVVSNAGPMTAHEVLLRDPLPSHVTYISGSAQATSPTLSDSNDIQWSGTVAPGQPVTITYAVTLDQQVASLNTAVITDPYGIVNRASAFVNAWSCFLPWLSRD